MAFHSSKNRQHRPMADINITPMVDVMLVLLVIFIMAAPLLTQSVQVNLPNEKASSANAAQTPTELSVNAAGQFFINQSPVTEADLPNNLKALAQKNAQTPIHIRADQAVAYAKVAQLLAAAQNAGLSQVSFVTQAGAAK